MSELALALSAKDARSLTEEVKADAAALWQKLLGLYEGEAHTALGYSSWGAYYEAEFGQSGRQGYRLLEAAKVVAEIPGDQLVTEGVARELTPLTGDPEQMAEAWSTAVERHGDQPTAAEVREVVTEHTGPSESPAPPDPGPSVRCPTCGHMVRPDDIGTWRE